jgi:H+-transporting ATPase
VQRNKLQIIGHLLTCRLSHPPTSQTVVLLVASIPLAIEIVTNTTLAIGSKALSHHGAIVARLSAIEDMAGMSILCSDKTGTLTLNKMVLQDETPVFKEGQTQESVLMNAALAAKWKEPARDALDRLTLGSVNTALLEDYEQLGKPTIIQRLL